MKKTINDIIRAGKRALVTLSLIGLTSCITYAKRDYDQYPTQRKEIAYYNIEQILADDCGSNFWINEEGFYCPQYLATGHGITEENSQFSWDEIKHVKCTGREIVINGKYDTAKIYCKGPIWSEHLKQCDDLEEAFRIYLKERKK